MKIHPIKRIFLDRKLVLGHDKKLTYDYSDKHRFHLGTLPKGSKILDATIQESEDEINFLIDYEIGDSIYSHRSTISREELENRTYVMINQMIQNMERRSVDTRKGC